MNNVHKYMYTQQKQQFYNPSSHRQNFQATIFINFTNTLMYAPFRPKIILVINQHIVTEK